MPGTASPGHYQGTTSESTPGQDSGLRGAENCPWLQGSFPQTSTDGLSRAGQRWQPPRGASPTVITHAALPAECLVWWQCPSPHTFLVLCLVQGGEGVETPATSREQLAGLRAAAQAHGQQGGREAEPRGRACPSLPFHPGDSPTLRWLSRRHALLYPHLCPASQGRAPGARLGNQLARWPRESDRSSTPSPHALPARCNPLFLRTQGPAVVESPQRGRSGQVADGTRSCGSTQEMTVPTRSSWHHYKCSC